jgi:hypothetical protein
MPFNDYNNYCNSKSKRNSIDSNASDGQSSRKDLSLVSLRLDAVSRPGSKADLVSLAANGVSVDLNMDTTRDLADFVVDPDVEIVGPVNAWLKNVSAKLTDDLVKTQPMLLNISGALLNRDKNNVVTFKSVAEAEVNLIKDHLELINTHLKTNYEVKSKGGTVEEGEEGLVDQLLRELESLREENQVLKQKLAGVRPKNNFVTGN